MTYVTLDKADGPECPHCGCLATEILKNTPAGTWFGGRQLSRPEVPIPPEQACQGTAVCSHCRKRFAVRVVEQPVEPEVADVLYGDEEPIIDTAAEIADDLVAAKSVPYPLRLRCPSCGSRRVPVSSTRQPEPPSTLVRRYHKCLACKYTFTSREPYEKETE